MTRAFDIASALSSLSKLLGGRSTQVTREDVRREVLDQMIAAGFERGRFYERCADQIDTDRQILILVTESAAGDNGTGAEGGADEPDGSGRSAAAGVSPRIGYTVAAARHEQGYRDKSTRPVVVADPYDLADPQQWVHDLDLVNRCWVDVDLSAGGESVGVLALDWPGAKSDLTAVDRKLLDGLGLMVGAHLQLRPQERLQELRATLTDQQFDVAGPPPPRALFDAGVRAIGNMMDARMVAVFEYHWSSGVLEKTQEFDAGHDAQRGRSVLPTGKESYGAGTYLTGKAWDDPAYQHVPLIENVSEEIERGSYRRHADHMGTPPYTVLYGRVNGLEPRFMVRLMNRRTVPRLPFVGERYMLEELLGELRTHLDRAIALHRTRCLEQATAIAAHPATPREVLTGLAPLLAEEGVTDYFLLCHRPPSTQFGYGGAYGAGLTNVEMPTGREWAGSDLYVRAMKLGTPSLVDLGAPARKGDRLASELRHRGYGSVLAVPISAGETGGALMIPLPSETPVRRDNLLDCAGAGRISLLAAYARLMGDAVDSAVAALKVDGARQALGLLGHELATPLARLGSTAEAALTEIHRAVVSGQLQHEEGREEAAEEALDLARSAAKSYLGRIEEERRSVGAAMRLAPIVAQESNGSLELLFEPFDLGQLILQAVSQTRDELATDPSNFDAAGRRRRTYIFNVAENARSLGKIVGDPGLAQIALINLLRNAAKYSIPASNRGRCEIDIGGQPQQGMSIVTITNIGSEIPRDQIDLIFEPWVRLRASDGREARRGMGLGLHLTRRIGFAHQGNALCRSSEPLPEADGVGSAATDADNSLEAMLASLPRGTGSTRRRGLAGRPHSASKLERSSRLQRYATVFELQLAHDLDRGPQVHEWRSRSVAGTLRARGK